MNNQLTDRQSKKNTQIVCIITRSGLQQAAGYRPTTVCGRDT